jgi:hypothetical protein
MKVLIIFKLAAPENKYVRTGNYLNNIVLNYFKLFFGRFVHTLRVGSLKITSLVTFRCLQSFESTYIRAFNANCI